MKGGRKKVSYRLFISHAWKHNDEYYNLIDMLDRKAYFNWTNYSVPEHDPFDTEDDLKEELRQQIRPVNAVLIIAGMYALYSNWIKFEIEFAEKISKPIIVIRPRGQEKVPVYLQEIANKSGNTIVNWNTDSIVEAIREYSI